MFTFCAPGPSIVRQLSRHLWRVQQGAMMNEAFQAREGLPPDLFPDTIPTYTGHYHKPHTVSNTSIRYVGSPYQSESAQHLSCLQHGHYAVSS